MGVGVGEGAARGVSWSEGRVRGVEEVGVGAEGGSWTSHCHCLCSSAGPRLLLSSFHFHVACELMAMEMVKGWEEVPA